MSAPHDPSTRVVLTVAGRWLVALSLVACAASTIFYACRSSTDWVPQDDWAQRMLGHQSNVTGVFAGVVAFGTILLLRSGGRRGEIVLAVALGLGGWALEYLIPDNPVNGRDVVAGFVAAVAGVAVLKLVRARGIDRRPVPARPRGRGDRR